MFNYMNSTIETVVKERHVFMGNTYYYGKIVSPFGNMISKKDGLNSIMKMAMMGQMFGNNANGMGNSSNGQNGLMMAMMMSGDMGDMFNGLFDFGDMDMELNEDEDADDSNEEVED